MTVRDSKFPQDDWRERPSVVCAGILAADLFVPPLPRLPEPGELLLVDDFLMETGGCAANVAACLAKLDIRVQAVGKVGNDHFGDFVEQSLRSKGVGTTGITRSGVYGTSKTIILTIPGKDHHYIHTIGANAGFTARDIDRALLSSASVFYLGGYGVLPSLEQTELVELLRIARADGACIVLDVIVPASGQAITLDVLLKVLPHVDVFMPNEQEAFALSGETESQRQAERFLEAGCGTAIITRGENGAVLATAGEVVEMPRSPVDTIDPSGAGDAFAAGFIVGLIEGWSMPESLRFASAIGASACTRLGCTTGVFTRTEAENYLREHPAPLSRPPNAPSPANGMPPPAPRTSSGA